MQSHDTNYHLCEIFHLIEALLELQNWPISQNCNSMDWKTCEIWIKTNECYSNLSSFKQFSWWLAVREQCSQELFPQFPSVVTRKGVSRNDCEIALTITLEMLWFVGNHFGKWWSMEHGILFWWLSAWAKQSKIDFEKCGHIPRKWRQVKRVQKSHKSDEYHFQLVVNWVIEYGKS